MKKNELTHIIKEIIAEEIRKQLPAAIAEVFQSLGGNKSVVNERKIPKEKIEPSPAEDETLSFKQSLREMFSGTKVIPPRPQQQVAKKFTSNPVLNEILNQTRPFSSQERTGASLGMAAMMASAQSNVSMGGSTEVPDMGELVPSRATIAPQVSQAQLMSDNHVPLSELPDGVSVMDVKHHVPPVVANALTRNYSQMMKLVDKKRGKV